jgi:hypothetical protein
MRVDYFQLMRKWRVDLIRYGLRMTYDIVVPNPGLELIEKVRELDYLKQEVRKEFSFNLLLGAITRDTYLGLAAGYNTEVDAPPQYPLHLSQSKTLDKLISESGQGTKRGIGTIDFDLPDGYQIETAHVYADYHVNNLTPTGFTLHPWSGLEFGPPAPPSLERLRYQMAQAGRLL